MKRMVWGAVLFLCMAAGNVFHVSACDDRQASRSYTSVFESEGNTVVITSDDEFVTVTVYADSQPSAEWM